jgi:hypothetical protein
MNLEVHKHPPPVVQVHQGPCGRLRACIWRYTNIHRQRCRRIRDHWGALRHAFGGTQTSTASGSGASGTISEPLDMNLEVHKHPPPVVQVHQGSCGSLRARIWRYTNIQRQWFRRIRDHFGALGHALGGTQTSTASGSGASGTIWEPLGMNLEVHKHPPPVVHLHQGPDGSLWACIWRYANIHRQWSKRIGEHLGAFGHALGGTQTSTAIGSGASGTT